MTRVLVAYESKHGATAEIAEAIGAELERYGLTVECTPAGQVRGVEQFDAVVIGSAVYMKHWRRSARRLLHRERKKLAERPLWIFSSGPVGKDADPSWAEPAAVVREAEDLGVRDHIVFGGRLSIEDGGFASKAMAKDTPEELRDLRDWDQIRAWAAGIAAELAREPEPAAREGARS